MSRDMTAAAKTASQAGHVDPIWFVFLELDGGDVRFNSADRDIVYSGDTYIGAGNFGTISPYREGNEVKPTGIRLGLSGVSAAIISYALDEDYSGRGATVWQGFLDSNGALIADPILIFEGSIDQMHIALGEEASVEVTAENDLIRWQKSNEKRYTNAQQQEEFSGDEFFEFVNQAVEKTIVWGSIAAGGSVPQHGGTTPEPFDPYDFDVGA